MGGYLFIPGVQPDIHPSGFFDPLTHWDIRNILSHTVSQLLHTY